MLRILYQCNLNGEWRDDYEPVADFREACKQAQQVARDRQAYAAVVNQDGQILRPYDGRTAQMRFAQQQKGRH